MSSSYAAATGRARSVLARLGRMSGAMRSRMSLEAMR